jgi:hypothetical protein
MQTRRDGGCINVSGERQFAATPERRLAAGFARAVKDSAKAVARFSAGSSSRDKSRLKIGTPVWRPAAADRAGAVQDAGFNNCRIRSDSFKLWL